MSQTRKYSLTLFGATGFTGGLCADYLAQHMPAGTSWAIAGRNEQKLHAVAARIQRQGSANPPQILIAEIDDDASLASMAADSKVVITTVGPYVKYGEPLARHCAEQGSHYCDLTGEPEFVNNLICRYHDIAKRNGAALVSCCGFDSIPHDAGALHAVHELSKALGRPLDSAVEVQGVVTASGTFSGGTWQSAITAFGRPRENQQAARHAKVALDNLYPKKARSLPMKPSYGKAFGRWLCPMPTIDPAIVLRSARALDDYGPEFKYGHYVGVKSLPVMLGGIAGVGSLVVAAQVGFLRRKLLTYKQSGDGPSADKRARSWFKVTFLARCGDTEVMTRVSGGDPGYDETAKMLAETGMAMALDSGYPKRTGVVTPVMALERRLIERLQAANMTFERLQ